MYIVQCTIHTLYSIQYSAIAVGLVNLVTNNHIHAYKYTSALLATLPYPKAQQQWLYSPARFFGRVMEHGYQYLVPRPNKFTTGVAISVGLVNLVRNMVIVTVPSARHWSSGWGIVEARGPFTWQWHRSLYCHARVALTREGPHEEGPFCEALSLTIIVEAGRIKKI